jgi:hypothetical protein
VIPFTEQCQLGPLLYCKTMNMIEEAHYGSTGHHI